MGTLWRMVAIQCISFGLERCANDWTQQAENGRGRGTERDAEAWKKAKIRLDDAIHALETVGHHAHRAVDALILDDDFDLGDVAEPCRWPGRTGGPLWGRR